MIRSLRKSRNLTQEQLGILSGMTKSQISRMEKGTLGSPETVNLLQSFKKHNAEKYGIESIALFGSFSNLQRLML